MEQGGAKVLLQLSLLGAHAQAAAKEHHPRCCVNSKTACAPEGGGPRATPLMADQDVIDREGVLLLLLLLYARNSALVAVPRSLVSRMPADGVLSG